MLLCIFLQVLVCAVWFSSGRQRTVAEHFVNLWQFVCSDWGTQFPFSRHKSSNYQPDSTNMHRVMKMVFCWQKWTLDHDSWNQTLHAIWGTIQVNDMRNSWIIHRPLVQNIIASVLYHRRIAMEEVEIETLATVSRFLSWHLFGNNLTLVLRE